MNKRVLFLSYRNFYPITSGEKITMMQNLVFLSKKYDVDCIILDKNCPNNDSINELKKYSKNITFIKMSNIFVRATRCLLNILLRLPIQNGYFFSRKMRKTILDRYKEYDAIFCMHMRTGQYVYKLDDVKKYIDCPDCITLNSKNEYLNSKGLRRLLFKLDYKNVKKFETTKYNKFDGVFVINKRDKEFLNELDESLSSKTHVLYNYVRDLGYKPENDYSSGRSICFLGRVAYGPNSVAIKYFVNDIFPSLKKEYPDLVFNVYGGSVTKEIKQLESIDGVKIHGFIEDVAKEIQSNTFVVAPMISGSGTQNKILECMRLKKLVITTKIGIDGLDDISSDDIIVCEGKDSLINNCLFFLKEENKRKMDVVRENSYNYVIRHFSIENSENQLLSKIAL